MKKIILSLTIIIFSLSLYFSISNGIENTARLQNNFNLDSTITCIQNELIQKEKNTQTLTTALNSCAKGMRSMGITGDIFVIRKSDKKLFWDASVDCKPEKETKLFMTENGICSLFKKPETCLNATKLMIENPPKGNLTWEFDDSDEFVDYRYLPIKIENEEYILGQGAQEDESNAMFVLTYVILGAGGILLILISGF